MTTRPRREPCPGVGYRAGGQEPRPPTGAPPRAGWLFSSAATVNTLVLAYAGASLPGVPSQEGRLGAGPPPPTSSTTPLFLRGFPITPRTDLLLAAGVWRPPPPHSYLVERRPHGQASPGPISPAAAARPPRRAQLARRSRADTTTRTTPNAWLSGPCQSAHRRSDRSCGRRIGDGHRLKATCQIRQTPRSPEMKVSGPPPSGVNRHLLRSTIGQRVREGLHR
jgi:hypothetical protein